MTTGQFLADSDNEAHNPGQADSDLFLKLKRWALSARDHTQEWRKEAEEDYAFVAGDQWSMEDKATLKDQLRPVLAFNRTGVIVDSVAGLEVQNRQEVRYLPRQMGKVQVNEVLTAAAKWFRDNSDAEDEESDSFLDSVICGLGCIDTKLDYEEESDGRAINERIDPIEMYWDPTAKKRNYEDRRYHIRAKKFAIEDAKDMFPEYADTPEMLHAAWFDNMPEADEPHNALEAKFYKNDQSGREAGDPVRKVMIVQVQWWDKEPYYKVKDPQADKLVDFPNDKYKALADKSARVGIKPPQGVKMRRKVFKQAFIGAEILESGPIATAPDGKTTLDRFTMNFITGKRDRNKNLPYGLVRVMKDPQRWANKFFSSLIHQFSTSGKGVIIETDAVQNVRNFEEEWARADGIKWAKPGTIGKKIQELSGGQINAGVMNMMEYAINSMRDVTGVNIELMGQAEKDQPGILEYQRKQAGMTILAGFFDGLRRFRKTQGHILLFYITHFFSDGRLIHIDGEDGGQYVKLLRDPSIEEYDVIVDDAPASPNQKEHTWLLITQLMPVLRGLTDPTVWAELLKYSPLPSSLTEKLVQIAQKAASQPPQMSPKDQADLQIKGMTAQANIEKARASALKDLSQAGISQPGPQEEILKSAVDALLTAGHSAQDHSEAMQQQQAEQAHEMQMAQLEHQHAMAQAQVDQQNQLVQNAQQASHAQQLERMKPKPKAAAK